MRCLVKVSIPVHEGNRAIENGTIAQTFDSILNEVKPEAAYFAEDHGERTAFIFIDLKDASQIPAISEPWFLNFNARVELHPAMTLEDLKRAAPGIDKAVKNSRAMRRAA